MNSETVIRVSTKQNIRNTGFSLKNCYLSVICTESILVFSFCSTEEPVPTRLVSKEKI